MEEQGRFLSIVGYKKNRGVNVQLLLHDSHLAQAMMELENCNTGNNIIWACNFMKCNFSLCWVLGLLSQLERALKRRK